MQWWCVAQPGAWDWTWSPLPGVWILVALFTLAYRRTLTRTPLAPGEGWRRACFGAALFLLWASLDWPVGPLGAGYLASVHMIQFLAVGVAAPALVLLGIPPRAFEGLRKHPRLLRLVSGITHPVTAFFVFNALMTASHWPAVVDGLMPTQFGSFVLDATWFFGGIVLWWPLVAPVPDRSGFHPLARIGYLALNAFLIRPPFAMMIFSEHPIYAIYELAPPPARDPMDDQQLAGAVMKIGTAWIMFAGVLVVFHGWMTDERPKAADGGPPAA